jgi:hypothetical protein
MAITAAAGRSPPRPNTSTPPRPPIKGRGARPHLTALIPAPLSSCPSPEHHPRRAPSVAAALLDHRLNWLTPPRNLTASEYPRPPLPLPMLSVQSLGARSSPWPSSGELQWPAMVTGPPWTELYWVHGSIDPVHHLFNTKTNSEIQENSSFTNSPNLFQKPTCGPIFFIGFTLKHLPLFQITISIHQSPCKFTNKPLELSKFQFNPPNFFRPYLFNRKSDFSDFHVKILRTTSSFIPCIHNTCLLHFD